MDQVPNISQTPKKVAFKPSIKLIIVVFLFISFGALQLLLFSQTISQNQPQQVATNDIAIKPTITPPTFEATDDNLKLDSTTAINSEIFSLKGATKELLEKNGFVVEPSYHDEFFQIYEANRYESIPNFVTSDSILHNYHLMFDFLLKKIEKESLYANLQTLNKIMLTEATSQYNTLKTDPIWKDAAKKNLAYFTIANALLDPTSKTAIPSEIKSEVDKELALITKHEEIQISPVMNIGAAPNSPLDALKEDYTQYIPRGHYDKEEILRNYFKTMMWYGRISFRFKDEVETKSAILISLMLDKGNNAAAWNAINEPVKFFVGNSDDITYTQVIDVLKTDKLSDINSNLPAIYAALDKLDPPMINSMPIFDATIQPDREKEIKGFRFMGQRFTLDAQIFQKLVYRDIKENEQGNKRMLPNGLDIPNAMGSEHAYKILKTTGVETYPDYATNITKLRDYVKTISTDQWTQNLYWGWLYTLKGYIEPRTDAYPEFMKTTAWAYKDLNSYLGSWSELKHDTILYAKQVYAEMGGGGESPENDDRGYVEPAIIVYTRLKALTEDTKKLLTKYKYADTATQDNLNKMVLIITNLESISKKELANETLTQADFDFIKTYGGQLEHFWIEANKDEEGYKMLGSRTFLRQNPAAIIADVATDPNGTVLEVGTGDISNIYVLVKVEGKLKIAKGGVYNYYEFPWPMNDRLTDTKWRDMLMGEQANVPQKPAWIYSFTTNKLP